MSKDNNNISISIDTSYLQQESDLKIISFISYIPSLLLIKVISELNYYQDIG